MNSQRLVTLVINFGSGPKIKEGKKSLTSEKELGLIPLSNPIVAKLFYLNQASEKE